MSERITAVVCAAGRDETERALASVEAQEPAADEVLVVPTQDGIGAAGAQALATARGELIAFCDPGEEWRPGRLATLAAAFEGNPEIDAVYGDAELLLNGGPPVIEPAEAAKWK